MTYAVVTVIVDGVLEEETFTDYLLMNEFMVMVEDAAREDGYPTEVFVVEHDHEPFDYDDCACVQYLTDHSPRFSWNMDGPGT